MAAAQKVARKDLKEDKVYMTMAEVVDYVVRYRLWIGLGVLAAVLIFGAGYYLHLRSQGVAEEASWALYQATYQEDYSEKMAALEKVGADYSGTPAGKFASFLLADTLYEDGKYEEAVKAFREFVKKNPNHILAPSAMEAIGFSQESLSQWKDAIDTYSELIRNRTESPAAARVNYRIGLCYERSGQKEDAAEAYETAVELMPNSLWAEYATERLSSLGPAVPAIPVPSELLQAEPATSPVEPEAAPAE
jgi:tetratricopeptide (TPR) repeat protein